jgi:hypothetical protein
VTGKALTGYVSGAGTLAATDTILTAINKLNGNDALKANLASPTFTGTVSGTFSGPLTGNVSGNVSGSSGSCTGNAATATNAIYDEITSIRIWNVNTDDRFELWGGTGVILCNFGGGAIANHEWEVKYLEGERKYKTRFRDLDPTTGPWNYVSQAFPAGGLSKLVMHVNDDGGGSGYSLVFGSNSYIEFSTRNGKYFKLSIGDTILLNGVQTIFTPFINYCASNGTEICFDATQTNKQMAIMFTSNDASGSTW